MKPPILGAIALIVGLGAGTGAKVMTTHPAPVVADSAKADSTAGDSTHAEGGEGHEGKVTDTAVVASGAEHAPSEGAAAAPAAKGHADDGKGHAEPGKAPGVEKAGEKPTVAPANAVAFAAALEARVESAKKAADAPPPVDTAVVNSQKRVAKIFTSMDAKAAAKVLVQMTDNDVHTILGYVGTKQAAQIMTALPPERVAKLSKLDMGTKE